ncbi:MAG: UDP-forming cellulose synthase catalytic subunit [Pseudomonadota bacterium]
MAYPAQERRADPSTLPPPPSPSWQRVQMVLWTIGTALLVYLAFIPTSHRFQLILSGVLLALLAICYRHAKRLRTMRSVRLARLAIIIICVFLSLRYMHWRVTDSLPLQFGLVSMVCGLLLFLAEAYGFVNMLLGFFINSEPFVRRTIALPTDEDALPHVDVYVPTYNEDASIIRPTVIAATQMRYPKHKLHVYLLDDGGTTQKCNDKDPVKAAGARERAAELKAIAERFGATYLTRERNEHAKAGNINSALSHTSGDLLLILDCDHIPTADFLERTVGFFLADPKLFVLQTPHNFVSPDPLERNLATFESSPAENELFYDVMQPGLDFWGTSFFCGSAAVLRRSVVTQLGGVSGQTITEDAETTLDALALGYKSAYYNRPMVSGLQPETYTGFIVQRVRWGQGMLQIFLLKNPWKQPGLTLIQRVLYTNFAFYWGFAVARIIMMLAPPAYLLFGINLCDTTSEQLLAYAGPSLLASLISTQFFFGRVRWPFMSQLYEIIQSVYVVMGLVEVVRNPHSPSFKVTPKGEVLDREFISALAKPFYAFLALTLVSIGAGLYRMAAEPNNQGAIAFVQFWAVLDVLLLLAALGIMFEKRQLRSEPRTRHEEPVRLQAGVEAEGGWINGLTHNASTSGLGLSLQGVTPAAAAALHVGARVTLDFPERQARLQGTVTSFRRAGGAQWRLGLKYAEGDEAASRLAVGLAFGSSRQLVDNNKRRHAGRSTLGGLGYLGQYAFTHGLGHLAFLASQQWARTVRRT